VSSARAAMSCSTYLGCASASAAATKRVPTRTSAGACHQGGRHRATGTDSAGREHRKLNCFEHVIQQGLQPDRPMGMIQVQIRGPDSYTHIRMTPAGRKLVRSWIGQKEYNAPPAGTLREWHWRALAKYRIPEIRGPMQEARATQLPRRRGRGS
jgi:hypothetical protein